MTPRRQNRDIDTNDLPIIRGSKGKRSTSKQNEIFPNFSQKEFVNNIAHEIRSPLQGVVNFVGTLRNEWRSFTDTEMDERLELLRDSCSSLMTFTNNLLEYSKHATGNLIQDVSSCNLISLIQEIIKDMNIIYYKNGWKINLEYEGELYDYRTNLDISQISKVLRNLIFNAVKYAAKKDIDIY
ncbi:MAG: sensor histidine kinase, partial [Alphaproteobacteria bacterium]|nr:sensor histidine kinase [Alphaproteobacteria bacterium]